MIPKGGGNVGRWLVWGAVLCGGNSWAAPDAPSVAVFTLEGRSGVDLGTVNAVTDHVVALLRSHHALSRVISAREVEATLGLERQQQILDCNTKDCMMEISGALDVDRLLTGSIGPVGKSLLVTLTLIPMRGPQATVSAWARVRSGQGDDLLDAMEPLVQNLLVQARLMRASDARHPALVWTGMGLAALALAPVLLGVVAATLAAGIVGSSYGLLPWGAKDVPFLARLTSLVLATGVVGVSVVMTLAAGAVGASLGGAGLARF